MAFEGRKVFLKSLGTRDPAEAKRLALPVLVELDQRIAQAQSAVGFWATHDRSEWLQEFAQSTGRYPGSPWIFPSQIEFRTKLQEFFRTRLPLSQPDQLEFLKYCETEIPQWYPNLDRPTPEVPPQPTKPPRVLLSELEAKLLAQTRYSERAKKGCRKSFGWLREIRGDCGIHEISSADIRELRDLLLKMPVTGRTKEIRKLGLREIAKREWTHTVSPASVQRTFTYLSSAYQMAVSEGWVERNPLENIRLPQQTPTSKTTERVDYTPADLTVLFQSDWFKGRNDRDYRFWLPYLALTSGARLSDLGQLGLEDLRQDNGIWYLSINRDKGKRTKNRNSVREVPLHSILVEMGFPEWAQAGLPWRHHYSSVDVMIQQFSQRFFELLNQIGLKRPGLTFHSFRHTFKSAARKSGLDEATNDMITGHLPQTVGGGYGGQQRLIHRLSQQINQIQFEGLPK